MKSKILIASNKQNKKPDEIDIYIGKRIYLRRNLLRITQKELANKIDISLNQIQKYEFGKKRISSNIIYKLAEVLNVKPSFFVPPFNPDKYWDPMYETDVIELVTAYKKINNPQLAQKLIEYIKLIV